MRDDRSDFFRCHLTGAPGAGAPAWLLSHPKTAERIAAIEAREARWDQPT